MNKIITGLLFLSFCDSCTNNVNRVISERKFTEIYQDSLKKLHPEATYTIKQDLEIHVKSKDLDFIVFLDNAYTSYKAGPDSLSSVLEMYLKSTGDSYKKEEPVNRGKIIPIIKDAGYLDEIAITLNQNKKDNKAIELVYEKYNDKLIILYGEDGDNGIAYFSKDRFKESGMSKDSLLQIALKNLNGILPEIQRQGDDGLYMLTAGGNYEASLILLNDIWTKEKMPVNGQIIISIPARDLLFVTGSKNLEGIKKMKTVAQESWENASYRLIPDLFIWDGKKFEPYN